MSLGSVQTVTVCVAGNGGLQGPCAPGQVLSVTQAYIIAASEAQKFELISQPFDPVEAGAYFGFAFATTIFLYLISLSVGALISFIRQA